MYARLAFLGLAAYTSTLANCALLGSHGAKSLQEPLLAQAHPHRSVSPALFAELEELARIVDISYCVGGSLNGIQKPFKCLSRCAEFPHFELVDAWETGRLLSDSCGYIALDHDKRRLIVAFRGTYSIANTVVDLSTIPQEYEPYPGSGDGDDQQSERDVPQRKCDNCTVHMGFNSAWSHTRDRIMPILRTESSLYPDYQLHLVGHSLGGAVAALAGLDLLARGHDPVITTFGEPRTGNAALAKFLDQQFGLHDDHDANDLMRKYRRVTHVDDPVPLLPLSEWGYAMHAGEIFITKSALSPDIGDLELCDGDNDQRCIAGQDSTTAGDAHGARDRKRDLMASVEDELHDVRHEPWGIPSRYKLWQLFFAHRDYFWRLGLCVPHGGLWDGGKQFEASE
ncbi:Alpha/Beta hydrolase protein [Neohortaea acidophila]|uniref:Alpha/Beta hydrolase protein n=1 Tax=Neohortaea acidophila TaxID=245834 RepID=A0A6A6PL37_9PEZI|nr:Alpha/Beta hydrolase protein [Neohortaea acidophila]KAF2480788.1 Alpha/Beta hydrolase protein [Neohortaea acidophila]